MKVVLSIKPEFANKIFEGSKKFEFRKAIFKNKNVKTVIVYASSPVQRVIGEFEIETIFNHDIDSLWGLTKEHSGISEKYFYEYFADRKVGYAIKIKKVKRYARTKCLKTEFKLTPPQSFAYYR